MSQIMPMLIRESGLSELSIRKIIVDAPERYKEYTIRKKNGGSRRVAQPAKELKILQRALVKNLISPLPLHDSATAYREGVSIRHNALMHAGQNKILKMDFKDFFPSIKSGDWHKYCASTGLLSDDIDIWLTTQILFQRPRGSRILRLAIGAPSSPALSNVLMFQFDTIVDEAAKSQQVTYSRYADDLTFSAARTGYLTGIKRIVTQATHGIDFPILKINHEKTTHITTKYRRTVTGLVLSNDGRVTIGRNKKREIRAAIHNFTQGMMNAEQRAELAGMMAFIKSAEPDYFKKLNAEYSFEMIKNILGSHLDKFRDI